MKKLYITRAIKIISLLLLLALAVLLLQDLVFREFWQFGQGSLRVKGFYREPKDSLDMVFIGDSTVYAAYAPPYAYELRGITSYNYAIGSNVCTVWRPITEEIMHYQDPQVIVVEIGGTQYDDLREQHKRSSTLHALLDNMPLSMNKYRTIRDLAVGFYGENALEYWLPFVRYHNEWSSFGELGQRIREGLAWRNILRGTITRVGFEPVRPETIDVRTDYDTMELAEESEQVLREYLEFCRDRDLNVIFVTVPCRYRMKGESRMNFLRGNRAGEIAEEYGFPYLNLNYVSDEIGLDPEQDFYNDGHMNYRGQIKFTDYFSRLLTEEYGVTPHDLTDRQRAGWEESAEYTGLLHRYAAELAGQEDRQDELLTERIEVMAVLDAMREEESSP